MINYIIRRLMSMIPILLGITVLSFFVIRLAPGKPLMLQHALNPKISLEEIQRLEKLEGLDKPIHMQYINWLKNIGRLNFGYSVADGRPVLEKIFERIPITLTINVLALLFILAVAIPLGVKSALRPGSGFDTITTLCVFLLFAAPTFWLALLMMQLFCITLGWFPISGIASLDFEYFTWWQKIGDRVWHLVLPVLVSALGGLAGISRYMRSSMLEVMSEPYIYTARAKGLPEKNVVYKHGLRNAILPIVTMLGLAIPGLLGGSIIFESIFAIPGAGRLFYEAALMRDLNIIMANVVIMGILTMIGNLIADISYAYIDPRIRYKK